MLNDEQLSDQFFDFMGLHRNLMQKYFQGCGMFNGQPFMLFHIQCNPGITQKELAREMNITAASVATSVKRLEAADLVRRVPDEWDGRVLHLYLTPEGEAMDRHCRRAKTILAAVQFDGFTDEERAALSCYLDRMSRNLQNARPLLFPGQ